MKAVEEVARQFAKLGAKVVEVSLPLTDLANVLSSLLNDVETGARNRKMLNQAPARVPELLPWRANAANMMPAAMQYRAAQARALVYRQVMEAFETVDVLLAPTTPAAAPPLRGAPLTGKIKSTDDAFKILYGNSPYTALASITGTPALSIPCGFTTSGLPMGAQIIGRPFGEASVLHIAHHYQRATDWHLRRPKL